MTKQEKKWLKRIWKMQTRLKVNYDQITIQYLQQPQS